MEAHTRKTRFKFRFVFQHARRSRLSLECCHLCLNGPVVVLNTRNMRLHIFLCKVRVTTRMFPFDPEGIINNPDSCGFGSAVGGALPCTHKWSSSPRPGEKNPHRCRGHYTRCLSRRGHVTPGDPLSIPTTEVT